MIMPKQVKVNLFGKRGQRTAEVTPQGFPTRHVRTGKPAKTEPLTIAPNPTPAPKPDPVLPAFTAAWKANRQRLIDFLSADYAPKDVSEGVIMHELAEAITAEYAPPQRYDSSPVESLNSRFTTGKMEV